MNPYTDDEGIRTFDVTAEDKEFVWHRDKEDRVIEILEGDGWQFQPDSALPFLMRPGLKFSIKAGEYHRIIKGINDLKIRINRT
tara:strand:- start:212 stop:463 length:252 start_codon:yes stop_codon:yes gene_type:complete